MDLFQYAPFLKQLSSKYTVPLEFKELFVPIEGDVAKTLRQRRNCFALMAAAKDLSGDWGIKTSLANISQFADFCLEQAFQEACRRLKQTNPPMALISVGKLGAEELNYSSDIDLMAFYDSTQMEAKVAIKISRQIISILEDRTADGYVFRTDFRLRPDPSMTPIAISLLGAESYYQSMGRTWERSALIRARYACGDRQVAENFLKMVQPFIWRKYLDFAAMDEIHAIKRQLGGTEIEVPGHNLKTGAGGIREIEFFAQTQQLIWGGKNPALRQRRTDEALDALEAAGHINNATRLKQQYFKLRQFENRLQMLNDQQTHTVPDGEVLEDYAAFCGFENSQALTKTLQPILEDVETIYKDLFEDSAAVIPQIIAGFSNNDRIQKIINGWQEGYHRVTKFSKVRELLEYLTPALLEAAQNTSDPDQALLNFDMLVSKLSSGVQLFSLLKANPKLLQRLVNIMGEAPMLANRLGNHPYLLDALLMKGNTSQLRPVKSDFYEDHLKELSRYVMESRFLAGLKLLNPTQAPGQIADICRTFSDIADNALNFIIPVIMQELNIAPGGFWVLAMGKHGSREMTVNSDLDLIFIYEDGRRSADYTKLCYRIVSSLTKPIMGEPLYNVDIRLRPSGHHGPVATSLQAFENYQQKDAWTWEHMALTRARVVYGEPKPVEHIIAQILTKPRNRAETLADIARMHQKLSISKKPSHAWHLKYISGGLMDVEFIAQALELLHPELLPETTIVETLEFLEEAELAKIYRFYQGIQSLQRLTIGKENPDIKASARLKEKLANIGGCDSFEALTQKREVYREVVITKLQLLLYSPDTK